MAGDAPQAQHLKLSRWSTFQRNRIDGSRPVLRFSGIAACDEVATSSTSLPFAYSTNACKAAVHEPKRRLYGYCEIVEGDFVSSMRRGWRP